MRMTAAAAPISIACQRRSRMLRVEFAHAKYQLSFAALRANSPAAGGARALADCAAVDVVAIDPVGNYAIKPRFSDGHAQGIYSWDCLLELCRSAGRRL